MLQKKNYTVAVVGATGVIGREVVELLEERNFPVHELIPLASERSAGETVEFFGRNWAVEKLAGSSFKGVDIAFFAAGTAQSLAFASVAVSAGAVVIDTSNAFRNDPAIPLIVPEINSHVIPRHAGIIANPHSSTIGMVLVLKPIHDAAKIRRAVVTTFQSASGMGKNAIDELAQQTVSLLNFRDIKKSAYPHQIAFNCIPHDGEFLDSGDTTEEIGLANETRRIMEDDTIRVTATSVHVPVFRCYSESVNIEMEKKIPADEIRAILSSAPGILVYDDPARNLYPMAIDVAGKDEIYVGRIRKDVSLPNGINLWLVMDNVRKGAALNAVQIAEHLVK
jgi:aspartate-semialdehyde dehydrogenase